ncbi:hypothetical protein HMPREF1548_00928 [Clostridium sp. KLE 1755]|jgi:hypothetical protein|nr:hypothetical protein HMPREF1548_00928 [Clostridium sp. KLE 1755]
MSIAYVKNREGRLLNCEAALNVLDRNIVFWAGGLYNVGISRGK